MLFAAAPLLAADLNGYVAKYEKNIGTPPACSATIDSVSDGDWSKLNDPNYSVICLAPGDYTSKGTITLSASGTSNAKRWLRYYTTGTDNGEHPVDMSARAIVKQINIPGSHWVVHRISVDGSDWENYITGTDNVLDKLLVENTHHNAIDFASNAHRNSIQNSVVRNVLPTPNLDSSCVAKGDAKSIYVVNNELYNCTDGVQAPQGAYDGGDLIIENNDIYATASYYSGSNYSCAENAIDLKHGGTPSMLTRVINNRVWGMKWNDTNCGGTGAAGEAIVIHEDGGPSDYVLVQNNIIFDSFYGVTSPNAGSDHVSIIGNIIFNISDPTGTSVAIGIDKSDRWEVYLNTIINSGGAFTTGTNTDLRCNLVINSPANGYIGSGTQIAYNAFYNSPTSYTGNAIVQPSATAAQTVQHSFWRKLHTGPEQIQIPNAKSSNASPHYKSCDPNLGARPDIGVSNSVPL